MTGDEEATQDRAHVAAALRVLGIENLVLVIHDQSYPSDASEDTGRGSPYSNGARRFLELARALGFNGIQFGPQGDTSRVNPSPYDGTLFSRNALSVALAPLTEPGPFCALLPRATLDAIVSSRPAGAGERVAYAHVYDAHRAALRAAFDTFSSRVARGVRDPDLDALKLRLAEFTQANAYWLEKDALFDALAIEHDTDDWRAWRHGRGEHVDQRLWNPLPGEEARCEARRMGAAHANARAIDAYAFVQLLAKAQHDDLRTFAGARGLKLFGDLQVGISNRDAWSYRSLFLEGYAMGAPPSRTNPLGQPWSYPVLDPAQYGVEGSASASPVLRFMRMRLAKLLAEFDGIRLDHPHGLVCPWVYRADDPNPIAAVQAGARLFDSPDLPDHPALARFAIARPDQLNPSSFTRRYDDNWVVDLTDAQVAAYSTLFDAVVDGARANGRALDDIVCEVLSTQPYPLARVMERYGLGRFRVTQKASLDDPADVYRTENAKPHDWMMVGNHDTLPIWTIVTAWARTGLLQAHAEYLAERLARFAPESERDAFAAALASDPNRVAEAMLADLFTATARNVMVFFPDLLGLTEVYNRPGVVDENNWTLRVPPTYREDYASKLARGAALNLPRALAMALRARVPPSQAASGDHAALLAGLDAAARRLASGQFP